MTDQYKDPQTGLRTRKWLERMEPIFAKTLQNQQDQASSSLCSPTPAQLCFLELDLDRLKHLNDEYGFPCGELALKRISRLLQTSLPNAEAIMRIGGDEFLIITHTTPDESAHALAERLRSTIAELPLDIPRMPDYSLTCSIGFASFPFDTKDPHAVTWQEVINIADRAQSAAKKSSRNAWVGIKPSPLFSAEGLHASNFHIAELRKQKLIELEYSNSKLMTYLNFF